MKTKGRIERAGKVNFHDASVSIWEEGISDARAAGGFQGEREWGSQFKRDVFARIVQALRRMGWSVGPWDDAERFKAIALNHRTCSKGDLKGQLDISGRCIKFEMWQDVTPSKNPNGGRYDFDKEQRMPYVLRLEMERTRRRIRDYLCNVFTRYEFEPPEPKRGPGGVTALEWVQARVRACCHYNKELDRRSGEESSYNNKSADAAVVKHGERVWFADRHGRIREGMAFYNINNMWWVITGRYDVHNVASFEIYTRCPDRLREKRNADIRAQRLDQELAKAIKKMQFERAATLRDIMFPEREAA